MLDKKDLEMIAEVFTKTIEPLRTDIVDLKSGMAEVKSDIVEMKSDIVEMKSDIVEMKSDIIELKSMDQMILEEIGREHEILVNRIEKVEKNLDELNQYYKITKLENDNTAILLQMINELSKRVEELEKRSA